MLIFSFLLIFKMPDDPLLKDQFCLNNTGIYDSQPGEDINMFSIWKNTDLTGKDIVVSIIGNGCYNDHLDLTQKRLDYKNFNFDDNSTNVEPDQSTENPGYSTGLLGIAIGSANNVCISGIAHDSLHYCTKLTKNDQESMINALEYNNDGTQIKIISTPKNITKLKSSNYAKFNAPLANKAYDNVLNGTIFITSSGFDAISGQDSNFAPETRNHNVITVSDTTASGSRAFWSSRGSSILVNAPAGGSSNYIGQNRTYPRPPTIGIGSEDQCSTDFEPFGVGSANVAGVVALMLEANRHLSVREVQAALIVSSVQNDPTHESWIENGAKFKYSNVYGFGRVDAEQAINAAKSISSLPDQKSTISNFKNFSLYPRMGLHTDKYNCRELIPFIEYVTLRFHAKNVNNLNIEIKSPIGTKIPVTQPSNIQSTDGVYEYTVRGFFGEVSHGNWEITFANEGYSLSSTITNVELVVTGLSRHFDLPSIEKKQGAENKLLSSPNLKLIVPSSIKCGKEFNIKIESSSETKQFDIFIVDKKSNSKYILKSDVEAEKDIKLAIPCHWKSSDVYIYAENRVSREGVFSSTSFVNENSKKPQIVSPKPYETLKISDNKLQVRISIYDDDEKISSYTESHTFVANLYDLDENRTISSALFDRFDNSVIFEDVKPCRCVLSVSPLNKKQFDGCDTFIQPINVDKEFSNFSVPLSIKCPLPPGVTVSPLDGEETTPGNITLRYIYMFSFIGVCAVLMIVILMWHLFCRKDQTTVGVDYAPLVTTE